MIPADIPTQRDMDAIRARVAEETATQQDCFRLLHLVDILKYNLFLTGVKDFESGRGDRTLLPVYRALIVSDWLTRHQRARRLWLRRCEIREAIDRLYLSEPSEFKADVCNALWIQHNAVSVRLARLCEKMTSQEVAAVCESGDTICRKSEGKGS